MPIYRGTQLVTPHRAGVDLARIYRGDQLVWQAVPVLPVVQITGTTGFESRNQFRQACIDYGTTYQTVQVLPFLLDTSQATHMNYMFDACSALTSVPQIDTSNVTSMNYMFRGCSALKSAPLMDTSNVTSMGSMFHDCSTLAHVPDMATGNVTNMVSMLRNCAALTDGEVRLIGRHPSVSKLYIITGSGLTREPFFDAAGNPI